MWRRLAEVDPPLFKQLTAIATGVVAAHDGTELSNSGDLHLALLAQAYGRAGSA